MPARLAPTAGGSSLGGSVGLLVQVPADAGVDEIADPAIGVYEDQFGQFAGIDLGYVLPHLLGSPLQQVAD